MEDSGQSNSSQKLFNNEDVDASADEVELKETKGLKKTLMTLNLGTPMVKTLSGRLMNIQDWAVHAYALLYECLDDPTRGPS